MCVGITVEQCCHRQRVKCEKLPVPMPPSSMSDDCQVLPFLMIPLVDILIGFPEYRE